MSHRVRVSAAALTVIVLTLFSLAVQADARIAWTADYGGPLTVVGDDGVSGRAVVAPAVTGFELAPTGDAVLYADPSRAWWLAVLDGVTAPVRLPSGWADDVAGFAWSPDGRELAVALGARGARDVPGPGARLVVVDRAGRTLKTWDMGPRRRPEGVAYRPDGKRIAFVRTGVDASHPSQVVLMARRAGGGPRVVRTAGRDHPLAYNPTWTRDGIALMVGNESWSSQDTDDILTLALVSGPGQPRYLGPDEGAPGSVSPDGRRFMLNASCVFDLRLGDCAIRSKLPGARILDLSPDGGRALVVYDGRLQVLRLEPNAMPYALGIDGPVWAAEWRAG